MNASSAKPTRKVASALIASALVTILVWLLDTFVHVEMPNQVAAALVTIIGFVVAYLVPSAATDYVASPG